MINKEKIKSFFAGVLVSLGTWMWIINIREQILNISPIQNQYILGAILIIIGWYLTR